MAVIGRSICWVYNYVLANKYIIIKFEFSNIVLIFTCTMLCFETQTSTLWGDLSFYRLTFKGLVIFCVWWTERRQKIIWTLERQKIIMSWWKERNVNLHNLLPSLNQIIYICLCMCMNMAVKCTGLYVATGVFFVWRILFLTVISMQCWDCE